MIASSVGLLKGITDINANIGTDFVDQSQRSHRHAPLDKRGVDLVWFEASFEKLGGVEQIRKQNPVHQKTRAVAHNHWQFSDLSHKGQAPLACFL